MAHQQHDQASSTRRESKDPSLATLTKLALAVVIPVVILLVHWARMPAPVPESRMVFDTPLNQGHPHSETVGHGASGH